MSRLTERVGLGLDGFFFHVRFFLIVRLFFDFLSVWHGIKSILEKYVVNIFNYYIIFLNFQVLQIIIYNFLSDDQFFRPWPVSWSTGHRIDLTQIQLRSKISFSAHRFAFKIVRSSFVKSFSRLILKNIG
jgi:hypothetical protein